jgi:CMP-N,N'-diacetyllegionaminic acid synthase
MSKIIALITARKDSKRVARKNLRTLWGEPLIFHTFKSALDSKKLERIILSTDDEEIIEYSKNFSGIEVLFKRPKEISQDNSTDWQVFEHALKYLDELNCNPEIVVHLRPTSPLRKSTHIDSAIEILIDNPDATSVRTVKKIEQSIFKTYFLREKFLEFLDLPDIPNARDLPTQILPETFMHIGYVDVIRASTILELKSMTGDKIIPYLIENSFSGINTLNDFDFYESLM